MAPAVRRGVRQVDRATNPVTRCHGGGRYFRLSKPSGTEKPRPSEKSLASGWRKGRRCRASGSKRPCGRLCSKMGGVCRKVCWRADLSAAVRPNFKAIWSDHVAARQNNVKTAHLLRNRRLSILPDCPQPQLAASGFRVPRGSFRQEICRPGSASGTGKIYGDRC